MNPGKHRICLLLGSNIEPEKHLLASIQLLAQHVALVQTSSIWESKAVGSDGPNFLNAAVLAMTTRDADSLKEQVVRPLEEHLGRVRTRDKNAPRTMDIDIILFDQQVLDPSLWHHAHRAVPVSEILPECRSETGKYLKDIASHLVSLSPIWVRTDVSGYPFSTVFAEQQ